MDALKLIQNQGFNHNEFILMDETLSVKQYTISEHKEWVINLAHVRNKTRIEKDTSFMRKAIFLSIGLFSLLLVWVNAADHSMHMATWKWIACSSVCAWFAIIVYLSPVNNKLFLVNGGEELVLLTDKPSEKEVHEFVQEIISRSKKVLLRKYSPDPDLPEAITISHLNWLFEIEVIDDKEFIELKANYYLKRNKYQSNNNN